MLSRFPGAPPSPQESAPIKIHFTVDLRVCRAGMVGTGERSMQRAHGVQGMWQSGPSTRHGLAPLPARAPRDPQGRAGPLTRPSQEMPEARSEWHDSLLTKQESGSATQSRRAQHPSRGQGGQKQLAQLSRKQQPETGRGSPHLPILP